MGSPMDSAAREEVTDLVARVAAGDARSVGRLISWVEDGSPRLPEAMAIIARQPGSAYVIGVTGPPGVGKSTMTSALVTALRARGQRVGVIAVDPSSPFSGGALLGDRIRMGDHATDPGVFIRSMASRGHLGGLSSTTPQAVRILSAAGFDIVLVETVGVGQSEVEVAASADTTLVLVAPGMGDGIQAAKAGILEVADVLCVNKADRDGAQSSARELRHMLELSDRPSEDFTPVVVTAVASRGEIDDVLRALDEHRDFATASGSAQSRRRRRAVEEITALTLAQIRQRMATTGADFVTDLAHQVADGSIDPFTAADRLRAHLGVDREGEVPG